VPPQAGNGPPGTGDERDADTQVETRA
jgi:hypothetical protein